MKISYITLLFILSCTIVSAQTYNRLHERMLTFSQSGAVSMSNVTSQSPDSLSSNSTAGQKNIIHHLGIFYHVFCSYISGFGDIYLRTSTDGIQWTAPVMVNDGASNTSQANPALAVIDSGSIVKVIVTWGDNRLGNNNVQFRSAVSNNGGISFQPSVQISSHNNSPIFILGNVACDVGGIVYVTWYPDFGGSVDETWFSRSTDGGYTWLPMTVAFNGLIPNPCQIVTRNTGEVLIVVSEDQFNKKNLIAVVSSDSGNTWSNHQFTSYTGFQEIAQYHSTIVDDSGFVHTVWTYELNGSGLKFLYARSNDFGASWSAPVQVSDSGVTLMQNWAFNSEQWPSIVRSANNRLYITWSDERQDISAHDRNVFIASSNNSGATWSTNIMVNDDSTVFYQAEASLSVRSVFTNDEVLVTWIDNRSANIINAVNEFSLTSSDVIAYPNPFTNELKINNTNDKGEVILFDISGKEILKQKTLSAETIINSSTIVAGFYLLNYSDGKRILNLKVVKF